MVGGDGGELLDFVVGDGDGEFSRLSGAFDLAPGGGSGPLFAVGVVEEVFEVGDVSLGGNADVLA